MVFERLFPKKDKQVKGSSSTSAAKLKEDSSNMSRSKKRKRNSSTTSSGGNNRVKTKEQQTQQSASTIRSDKSNKSEEKKSSRSTPPSHDALELSSRLKQFSTQKNLSAALELYHSPTSQPILDEHHLCIVVDCCGRCGNIDLGQKLVDEWIQKGKKDNHRQQRRVNVHTKTALMKGYAHSGQIDRAEKIYLDMQRCEKGDKYQGPNVRTLNTLLRGCLWAAVSIDETGGNQMNGGVVTADAVWPKGKSSKSVVPDTSSYEYYICLLSQALRCQDAQKILDEFMRAFDVNIRNQEKGGRCHYQSSDASILETLGISLFHLARAHAILGNYAEAKACAKRVLDVISSGKDKCHDNSATNKERNNKFQTTGGKRGKKAERMDGRREISNTLFRNHKMEELETNAKDVLKNSSMGSNPLSLAKQLSTKVLYFSGGGTTDLSVLQKSSNGNNDEMLAIDSRQERRQLLNALWFSFGLSEVMQKAFPNETFCSGQLHHGRPISLTEKECSRIFKALNLTDSYVICDDGTIDFSAVFQGINTETKSSKKRALNIELGSGFGEWAVHQAHSNPSQDYVAVELRSDRVSLTFSKAYLQSGQGNHPLNNLCCVGAECGSFLGTRVKPNTVSRIFVNHPEPPTQTIGANNSLLKMISDGGAEPAHMLNSATLIKAARCLDSETGEMVIVTDNRWYANLICATLLKVMKQEKDLFFTTPLDEASGIRPIDVFHGDSKLSSVTLYEGQPNESIAHSYSHDVTSQSSGSTYFDRLWRKGAGNHADVKKRYIICMCRNTQATTQQLKSSKDKKEAKVKDINKNSSSIKRKRSASRQQKHNKRKGKI